MAETTLSDFECEQLSLFISNIMGLHFPQVRWPDLRRGIGLCANDLGYERDVAACARWLLRQTSLPQVALESLSRRLTVGETYFLREFHHFEILARQILPDLMRSHEARGNRRLRIWSAACCSGEEAYSVAICLHRMIPDLQSWGLSIVGSDINPDFLRHARAGVFGNWSFRDAPAWLPEYFHPTGDGRFEILPHIKRMVTFAPLNLVEDILPLQGSLAGPMDVVFCRNVLMYFTEALAQKALENIFKLQADGGWLILGSSELMHLSAAPYVTCRLGGRLVYRKMRQADAHSTIAAENPSASLAVPQPHAGPSQSMASPSADVSATASAEEAPPSPRALADEGRLAEALAVCEASLRLDKMNAPHHYLRGLILKELGDLETAALSFDRALYLAPQLVAAHVALGHLNRERGRTRRSHRHFDRAIELMSVLPPHDILPESDGMTVGRCMEMIVALSRVEVMA